MGDDIMVLLRNTHHRGVKRASSEIITRQHIAWGSWAQVAQISMKELHSGSRRFVHPPQHGEAALLKASSVM